MQKFSEKLIAWYDKNKRELPWRNTDNPYYIWLSEIILQQTRVDQGLPYYYKFVETFPKIQDLANADQDEVLRLWQGLGYYSRGRNLHFTAKMVVHEFNGKFPTNYDDLIRLKGVGAYTAAAISSFCANQHKAVVDGNVYRVLARYFGLESDTTLAATQKEFQALAQQLLPVKHPGKHNQAIMEFGALQCVPRNPDCNACPLQSSCYAFKYEKVSDLPYKSNKVKVKVRYFTYLVLKLHDSTFIKRRPAGDIWEGLYEFPLIENKEDMDEETILNSQDFNLFVKKGNYKIIRFSKQYKHQLSHQTLFCRFVEIDIKKGTKINGFDRVLWDDLELYPKPILIQNYYKKKNSPAGH